MILILSLGVAILFGAGAYLLLKEDLLRVIVGMVLLGNAANLFIMAAALTRGEAPIYPLPALDAISDPLVQAMTLTAIVISFGVAALLLALTYRVYIAHLSVDLRQLAEAEQEQVELDEMDEEMLAGAESATSPLARRMAGDADD
jgi:multicomponent Na+:H+ antiporter subunit C